MKERVRLSALHRQLTTLEYVIRTAHGGWIRVDGRLSVIVHRAGKVLAIGGIIDRARYNHATAWTPLAESDEVHLPALRTSSSSR